MNAGSLLEARPEAPLSRGKLLAKNTVLNLFGQVLPLVAGVLLIPRIIRGLGPDRFGVLGIVWLINGYFSLFDFGLGRATTKFLAEKLAKRETDRVPDLVFTSIIFQGLLGVAGCIIFAALTPVLVGKILKIPPALVGEARTSFLILAATLPIMLITSGLRAVLEGCERFDMTNALRIPISILGFIIPAAGVGLGVRLPGIVLLLAFSRLIFAIGHLWMCLLVLPCLRRRPRFHRLSLLPLLSFGGWVTVGNLVNPLLVSVDRFLIGSGLSMAMVGYYTAPMEVVTKLWIIPGSLTAAVFPACSILGQNFNERLDSMYAQCIRCMFLVLAPITVVLVVFARPITQVWLGNDFVLKSASVLQVLAIGVFFNCFTHIPYCFLQGLGRPEAPVKVFVLELIPYAILTWWMIHRYGIVGAAVMWSARVAIEMLVLMYVARRLILISPQQLWNSRTLYGLLAVIIMALGMGATRLLVHSSMMLQSIFALCWLAGFGYGIWKYVLQSSERSAVIGLLNPLRSTSKSWGTA